MFKIGVLSDTHVSDLARGVSYLQRLTDQYFREAEMILHAGDVVNPEILQAFSGRTVHLVRGNMDPPVQGVPNRKIVEVCGYRIGLIHGWGAPDTLEGRMLEVFRSERIDCLVYGHSHSPVCHYREGILMFNPGSPTDRRRALFHSVGVLELGEKIEGRIISLDE